MSICAGIDIGGTKCALSLGDCSADSVKILHREEFPTAGKTWREVLDEFVARIGRLETKPESIGISCGGPLDSRRGLILSPPNLPGWDEVPIVKLLEDRLGVPVKVQNDANACAYAEWKFGAGRGTRNMVFMTFGTGLGAGLVLDGRLYVGTNDNAGEIGHLRLAPDGPIGYNKAGSAEGFCSGAGIARLAVIRARERGLDIGSPTTKDVFAKVREGDPFFMDVFRESAEHLGMILSWTIDLFNPEVIVLGGVYMRNADLFEPALRPVLEREALPLARQVCRIVPAALSENVGDYAALSVAVMEM